MYILKLEDNVILGMQPQHSHSVCLGTEFILHTPKTELQ